ncbi:MAG TPA: LuxR C-terminal-related transcriptional regulator, partial [Acidimicrobiia bacterium]|nr:LuxR C-terminal-related transcriptional regulator [Acidimicrobiia bacterium]
LFAGWVYCNVISTCYGLADVKRAAEWCQAALRWCDDLDDGRIYPGLCRVYAAELALLQGDWAVAATSAEQACRNLDAHDPRYAGEAYYLVGEACRRRGDIDGAEEAFIRAHGLGRLPQPGLALVRLEQGRADHAVKALRASLDAGPASPLPRAQLLGALVEACAAVRDDDGARAAADELTELAGQSGAAVIAALARLAAGHVALVAGRPDDATTILRQAWQELAEVGLLHEAARARFLLGSAASALNDDETGAMEVLAALAVFEQLGAEPDVRRAREFLEPSPVRSALLSSRELEVLRLVASGATNREIAETLVVSRHTVTRHVSNIFTKIGVASRAAATAYAYEHGMV